MADEIESGKSFEDVVKEFVLAHKRIIFNGDGYSAEWEEEAVEKGGELYMTEICLYAHNRTGILLDISKVFMELKVDIKSVSTRTSKQGLATIVLSFEIGGIDDLNHIIKKLRNIESVIDIERSAG